MSRRDGDPLLDLLYIGENHLGVDPVVADHGEHVLGGEEVRHPG